MHMTINSEASEIYPGDNRMAFRPRTVSIRQLPDSFGRKQQRVFLRDLERDLQVVRPAVVIDCSNAGAINRDAIHLLLRSLEEAMKRNGDIRLSGVSPQAMLTLASAGVDRLFRIYPTIGEAVESFHRRSHVVTPPISIRQSVPQGHAA